MMKNMHSTVRAFLLRVVSVLALITTMTSLLPMNTAQAASSFKVGRATVTDTFVTHNQFNCDMPVGSGRHVCCWQGAQRAYTKIWGVRFERKDSINMLSKLPSDKRKLNVSNLTLFFSQAQPGSMFRMDQNPNSTSGDEKGHSMIFLKLGKDGAYFFEANFDGKGGVRTHYWTWKKLVSSYGSRYPYIKYLSSPNSKKLVTSLSTPSVKLSNMSNGVKITWSAVSNAESYTVYRDGKQLGTTTGTEYTDKNVKNGSSYTYTVKAHYKTITSKASANAKIMYLSAPALSSLTASNYRNGTYQMKLSWNKNSAAKSYEIQYSKNASFTSDNKTSQQKGTKERILIYAKGTYYVRIRAINGSYKSAWSAPQSIKIPR